MNANDTKVLGVVAIVAGTKSIFCIGESCIVAASEEKMQEYISRDPNCRKFNFEFSKARFGHVNQVLRMGGAYAFDKESYSRFFPLGIQSGINLCPFPSIQYHNPNLNSQTFMSIRIIDGYIISDTICNDRSAKVS